MKAAVETITPARARELLAGNDGNRNVRQRIVDRYARDMKENEWTLNGEPVILNGKKVLDGQHRLLACVQSQTAFQTIVVYDAPAKAMGTIDQGISRKLSDVLKWRGNVNVLVLSSAVVLGLRWERGEVLSSDRPSVAESVEWLNQNPELVDAIKKSHGVAHRPTMIRPSVAANVYLKAADAAGEDEAGEFFGRVADGIGLREDDAIRRLRTVMMKNASSPHAKMNQANMLALMIKSWNAWITGEPVKQLSWRRGGPSPEPFPLMVDGEGYPISVPQ